MTEKEIVRLLKQKQGTGTRKELAEKIGVSPAYLSDIFNSNRRPAGKVLKFLGLKKEVAYR